MNECLLHMEHRKILAPSSAHVLPFHGRVTDAPSAEFALKQACPTRGSGLL